MNLGFKPARKPFDPQTIRGIGIGNADLLHVGDEITLNIAGADAAVLRVDSIDSDRVSVHVVGPDAA